MYDYQEAITDFVFEETRGRRL